MYASGCLDQQDSETKISSYSPAYHPTDLPLFPIKSESTFAAILLVKMTTYASCSRRANKLTISFALSSLPPQMIFINHLFLQCL